MLKSSRAGKLEREFQSNLVKHLEELVGEDGYVLLKPGEWSEIAGFPDLLIIHKNGWPALECKRSSAAEFQPLQEHYVAHLNELSFARVIYPGNAERVLDELRQELRLRR
jgi:hypothetical protein